MFYSEYGAAIRELETRISKIERNLRREAETMILASPAINFEKKIDKISDFSTDNIVNLQREPNYLSFWGFIMQHLDYTTKSNDNSNTNMMEESQSMKSFLKMPYYLEKVDLNII